MPYTSLSLNKVCSQHDWTAHNQVLKWSQTTTGFDAAVLIAVAVIEAGKQK